MEGVPSEDDEDTEDEQVFKRRRTNKVVASPSSSIQDAESLRERPPSATSPPHQMVLEGRVESKPPQTTPTPAPKLPQPVQELLRGYLHRVSPGGQSEEVKKEGVNYYLGAFLACANSWRDQARAKASEISALQALEKECASLKEEKRRWKRQEEAYKNSSKEAQKAKDAANKRLHEAGQTYTELLGQVVPLRVEIAELKDTAKTTEAKMKKLKDHCVDREVKLGATEAALEAKTKAFDLLEAKVKAFDLLEAELQAELVKAFSFMACICTK